MTIDHKHTILRYILGRYTNVLYSKDYKNYDIRRSYQEYGMWIELKQRHGHITINITLNA